MRNKRVFGREQILLDLSTETERMAESVAEVCSAGEGGTLFVVSMVCF